MQDAVWNLRHSASDHIPDKLSLCIGLPVMIRNNDATELCITKGQEGHVVGWKSGVGSRGQLVLETLYVKLDRPAKDISIEGLPENKKVNQVYFSKWCFNSCSSISSSSFTKLCNDCVCIPRQNTSPQCGDIKQLSWSPFILYCFIKKFNCWGNNYYLRF